jgi:flagellar hook-basal body complex protein FliE
MTRPIGNDSSELLARLIADQYGPRSGAGASGSPLAGLVERRFEEAYQLRFGAEEASGQASEVDSSAPAGTGLGASLRAVDEAGLEAGEYAQDFISGEIRSINELVVRAKRAEMTFSYTLAIRDRLVEAYREVMRMSV